MNSALTMLADPQGGVVMGFVNKEIFYVRFIGHVSTPLGTKCATLLRKQLANTPVAGFFCDAEPGANLDLSARSAIIRAFLDNRCHLESMTTLVGSPIVAATVRAIATVLDGLAYIAETPDEFHSMLIRAAPYAQAKLPRDKWTRTMLSERPDYKSVRSMRVAPRR
ncbi:MAG TPA: hypothetical protein VK550_21710 [Polyangiaceae bacterium]|nr:hypothetical protein [Polyangiaceae bacterium]